MMLLSAPFECVLTQSFAFLTKGTSQRLLQRQYHQMLNAGDFAVSQAEELKEALDGLTANEFVRRAPVRASDRMYGASALPITSRNEWFSSMTITT